jgi:hypothetical protein
MRLDPTLELVKNGAQRQVVLQVLSMGRSSGNPLGKNLNKIPAIGAFEPLRIKIHL